MAKASRVRLIVRSALIATVVCLLVVGAILVRRAQREARRSNAYGRLCQMRLALQGYESQHGTLPPLCLRDNQRKPVHSWRALILPHLDGKEWFKRLDLSRPWNSDHNRKIIDAVPLEEWTWFARDLPARGFPVSTHILAYLGPNSIWDAKTDAPIGRTGEHPGAILLVSIPESNIRPLQPGDITENEIRKLVEDGHEVLFILAAVPYGYGVVTTEGGRLTFHSWQETLDRMGGAP